MDIENPSKFYLNPDIHHQIVKILTSIFINLKLQIVKILTSIFINLKLQIGGQKEDDFRGNVNLIDLQSEFYF